MHCGQSATSDCSGFRLRGARIALCVLTRPNAILNSRFDSEWTMYAYSPGCDGKEGTGTGLTVALDTDASSGRCSYREGVPSLGVSSTTVADPLAESTVIPR